MHKMILILAVVAIFGEWVSAKDIELTLFPDDPIVLSYPGQKVNLKTYWEKNGDPKAKKLLKSPYAKRYSSSIPEFGSGQVKTDQHAFVADILQSRISEKEFRAIIKSLRDILGSDVEPFAKDCELFQKLITDQNKFSNTSLRQQQLERSRANLMKFAKLLASRGGEPGIFTSTIKTGLLLADKFDGFAPLGDLNVCSHPNTKEIQDESGSEPDPVKARQKHMDYLKAIVEQKDEVRAFEKAFSQAVLDTNFDGASSEEEKIKRLLKQLIKGGGTEGSSEYKNRLNKICASFGSDNCHAFRDHDMVLTGCLSLGYQPSTDQTTSPTQTSKIVDEGKDSKPEKANPSEAKVPQPKNKTDGTKAE